MSTSFYTSHGPSPQRLTWCTHFESALSKVTNTILSHMKPGGWIEFQEISGEVQCDDGSMAPDDILKDYYRLCVQAMRSFGMDIRKHHQLAPDLEKAGFINIGYTIKKIPLGSWARDKTLRLVGQYARLIGLDGCRLTVLGKPWATLGFSAEERQVWAAKIRQSMMDDKIHRYYNFYFWTAQKPE